MHAEVCVYLIGSILAVLAVLTNVMLQFLDLQLDLIVLLPYFIGYPESKSALCQSGGRGPLGPRGHNLEEFLISGL